MTQASICNTEIDTLHLHAILSVLFRYQQSLILLKVHGLYRSLYIATVGKMLE